MKQLMNINGEKKKQLMNINGEKKKQLMNINGEKNVQREKCSAQKVSVFCAPLIPKTAQRYDPNTVRATISHFACGQHHEEGGHTHLLSVHLLL